MEGIAEPHILLTWCCVARLPCMYEHTVRHTRTHGSVGGATREEYIYSIPSRRHKQWLMTESPVNHQEIPINGPPSSETTACVCD